MRASAIVVLLGALLAGCAQPAARDAAMPTAEGEGVTLASGGTAVFASFASDANVDEVVEFAGAFGAHEMGGAIADAREMLGVEPANVHVHDLSSIVPIGLPTRIRFEVDSDPGHGDLDAWLQMEAGSIGWAHGEAPTGGAMWFEYFVTRQTQEPVELRLRYDEPGEHPEVPYLVTAEVNSDAETLRAGLPALLAVPAGATALLVESDGLAEDAALLVWDPHDVFVGRVPLQESPTRIPLSEDWAAGEYVVMPSSAAARARIAIVGATSEPLMRPVAREVFVGEPQRGDGSASWTFTTTRVPIMAGIRAQGGEVAHEYDATLTSEAGAVVSVRIVDEVPWLLGVGFGTLSRPGDPNVVAGRYTAEVAFAVSAGPTSFEARELLVHYKR